MLLDFPSAGYNSESGTLKSPLVFAALVQGTREEAPHGGFQYLHCTHPLSLPASAHPGNIENVMQNVFLFCSVFTFKIRLTVEQLNISENNSETNNLNERHTYKVAYFNINQEIF